MRAAILPALLLLGAQPDPGVRGTRVDPLRVQDDDFARHRSRDVWRGLDVERLEFSEERARWRLWRIVETPRRDGPLWFVPHDNENAGFEAALEALRLYGGTIIAVDAGVRPGNDGGRYNGAVSSGRPVDPNRTFSDGLPLYTRTIASARAAGQPIVALHTNNRGYDPRRSTCPPLGDTSGRGTVSIRYCSDVLDPSISKARAWPFDDDDTVAFVPWLTRKGRSASWCGDALVAADFNVIWERVDNTDGSLSNYAILRGIPYLNFETQERGLGGGLTEGRDRLLRMIERAREVCPKP
jgi:hypothetical protein